MLCCFYLLGPRSTDSKSAVLTNCTITPGTVSTWTVRVEGTKKVVYIFLARVEGRSRIPPSSVHTRKQATHPSIRFIHTFTHTTHNIVHTTSFTYLTWAAHTGGSHASALLLFFWFDRRCPTYLPPYLPSCCVCL